MTSPSAEFLSEIRDAAARLGFTPKTLCQKAVRNQRLVERLEAGQRVTVQTVMRFRAFVVAAEKDQTSNSEIIGGQSDLKIAEARP